VYESFHGGVDAHELLDQPRVGRESPPTSGVGGTQ
jgi:hypothetical protein